MYASVPQIWGHCWHEWRRRTECAVRTLGEAELQGKPVSPVSFQCLLLPRYYKPSPGKWLDMKNLSTDTCVPFTPHPTTPASKGQSLAGHSGEHHRQGFLSLSPVEQAFGGEHHCGNRKLYSWRCSSRLSGPNLLLE